MRALYLSMTLLASCATTGATGGPVIDDRQTAYWVWREGDVWRFRSTAGGKPHRFQGSIEGLTGGIVEVRTERSQLRDHVAQVANTVQFDYDADDHSARGFDVRSTGGCLKVDLMIDGKRRSDAVHYGHKGEAPSRLPTELCP